MLYNPRLLYPRYVQFKNRIVRKGYQSLLRGLVLGAAGMLFWAAVFIIFYRVLYYFKTIDVFGSFLAAKLLSMVFLTFFSILIFSNIITAISTFFMSHELQLLIASPFDANELYYAKMLETVVNSSWMVLLFSLPVFLSYGIIFEQPFYYYGAVMVTLVPFLLIAGALGTALALVLVTVFPARRLKEILVLMALVLIVGLYLVLRMLKPERLVDPDAFFTVVDYLSSLEMPTSVFFPSQWATDILSAFLFHKGADQLVFNSVLLWSTALAFIVLLNWFTNSLFFNAWSKSQEARTARITRFHVFDRVLQVMLAPLSSPLKAIIDKDIRSFFRDAGQWSQLLVLTAIIIIYLYNFSVLPLDKSPIPSRQLQNIFAFLNLGLAGFVIAAVAVRFAYPAVSLEGSSFWIIKASPLGMRGLLWCKFWVNAVFLTILAEILIVCSNIFLRVDDFMMVLSIITVLGMTLGLTGMSVGFGAMYPRFEHEHVAQISTGFGGFMYMILSVLFIGSIVVLEAWPVHMVIMSRFLDRPLSGAQILQITAAFALILILCLAGFLLPLYRGMKRLAEHEEF